MKLQIIRERLRIYACMAAAGFSHTTPPQFYLGAHHFLIRVQQPAFHPTRNHDYFSRHMATDSI